MIEVTRINGTKVLINPDLMELVEETPDTVIAFTTGDIVNQKSFKILKKGYFLRINVKEGECCGFSVNIRNASLLWNVCIWCY